MRFPTWMFGQGVFLLAFFVSEALANGSGEILWDDMTLVEYSIPAEVDLMGGSPHILYAPAGDEVGFRLVGYTDGLIPVCILTHREIVKYQPVVLGNEDAGISELVSYPVIGEKEFKAPCSAFTPNEMKEWGVDGDLAKQLAGAIR